ncbi:hypothetical protein Y032_0519g2829 [Ancylostoma ceylanicum]|uniref:Uncharacterized protein n=1 Tax=Ancylostoma ceylanicum TaxID=53326 RepID=A0A016WSX2_9BILA|nr:hypothetical protein Y032_0519g2829 [Ancylostoma ceylanicum]
MEKKQTQAIPFGSDYANGGASLSSTRWTVKTAITTSAADIDDNDFLLFYFCERFNECMFSFVLAWKETLLHGSIFRNLCMIHEVF